MKQAKQAKQALENECGDTFVFCPSFYHQLRAIKSVETRLMVYEAVVEYGVLGKVPDFSTVDPFGLIDGIFAAIKYVIDSTKSKRVYISNERSKAGKNGGAPKGNQNARKHPKTSKGNRVAHKCLQCRSPMFAKIREPSKSRVRNLGKMFAIC